MPSLILPVLLCAGLMLVFTTPVAAFGAGNIVSVSQIAGKNWRHGDIEDVLLELFISVSGNAKFDRLAVKRVYFGNWLRDYSQAVDVGGLKQLPKDTIRILLWVLSFVTFGFATGEFEVTEERLGCYRPEEHIDNPKDYADNEDARKYDSRLRGPVDEAKELAVDERTGMKAYIASEDRGIDTSAGLVRKKFVAAIERGRAYGRDGNEKDLYEALRLLGTGLHCLEDYSAHSNYVELALREMGVDVFPHVGENTELEVNGKRVWPLVTGTFGMTDFLHSVVGEVSDKVVQSEVQELDNKLSTAEQTSQNDNTTSTLKSILDNIPFGLLGLGDSDFGGQADKLQEDANAKQVESKANVGDNKIAGMDVDQLKTQAAQTMKEIYPIMEFHDKVMKAMQQGIEKIPGASELLENLTGAMQIFIFSILAPYVKPILQRVKTELAAGSGGVLQASENAQFNVFQDANSSDPTHSVLSKDHFTNVLNEVAGRVATEAVRFATPLIVSAWEDTNIDPNQICDEILQILHHPALRDEGKQGQRAMFEAVRSWWEGKDDGQKQHLTEALGKDGVRNGKNHEGEDPNPGPGGCNHSHGGLAKAQGQSRSGGGGGYNAPTRAREETGTYGGGHAETGAYGGSGGGHGSREEKSYGGGGGYGSTGREGTSSYGGGREREETSHGGGYGSSTRDREATSGGYGSSNTRGGYDSSNTRGGYDSSNTRRGDDTYGSSTGGYGGEDLSGSSARHWGGEDTSTSYSATRQESSYSSRNESSYTSRDETLGRNEDSTPSYRSREEDAPVYGHGTSTYGRDNQASYEASTRDLGVEDSHGSGTRWGNDSYGSSTHRGDDGTPSYGRNRDDETSSYVVSRDNETSYGRSRESESSYGRDTSSYSRVQDTSSYEHGNRGEEASAYGRGRAEEGDGGAYGRDEGEGYGGGGRNRHRQGQQTEENDSSGYGGGGY